MLYAQENWIQVRNPGTEREQRLGAGGSDVQETPFDKPGDLFRFCVREHGRCISKVYRDAPDGGGYAIGWVFLRRRKFDDCNETYLCETWVTVHAGPQRMAYDVVDLDALD